MPDPIAGLVEVQSSKYGEVTLFLDPDRVGHRTFSVAQCDALIAALQQSLTQAQAGAGGAHEFIKVPFLRGSYH